MPNAAALDNLQHQAVNHDETPLLIVAGPGSGKTRVLCHRIARLVDQGIHPGRILAMTFTRKATREMSDRLDSMMNDGPRWVTTFHGLCTRILRHDPQAARLNPEWEIADTQRSRSVARRAIEQLHLSVDEWNPTTERNRISLRKNREINPKDPPEPGQFQSMKAKTSLNIHIRYDRLLADEHLLDFDDLLLRTAKLLKDPAQRAAWSGRWDHVLVDEFQDTNLPQYRIMRALAGHRRVTAVCDPDQSIYGWRGAETSNINRYRDDFRPSVVELERNYRSKPAIVAAARAVIEAGADVPRRNLASTHEGGAKVKVFSHPTEHSEANWIHNLAADAYGRRGRHEDHRLGVLYRINALSRPIEERLIRSSIPYTISGGARFYDRREIQDAVAYLRAAQNPGDDEAFDRIINRPPRGLGKEAMKTIRNADIGAPQQVFELPFNPPEDELRDRDTLVERTHTAVDSGLLGPRQTQAARNLLQVLSDARRDIAEERPPADILSSILDRSGYTEHLKNSGREEDLDRLDNLDQLVETAKEHQNRADNDPEMSRSMKSFLDEVALMTDREPEDASNTRVHLMTMHAAKGLEFPTVVLAAAEGKICPLTPRFDEHEHRQSEEQLQEERRLFYVGMTRAEENLYISNAASRMRFGERRQTTESPYINAIPPEWLEHHEMNARLAVLKHPINIPPPERAPEQRPAPRRRAAPPRLEQQPTVDMSAFFPPPDENYVPEYADEPDAWEDGELYPADAGPDGEPETAGERACAAEPVSVAPATTPAATETPGKAENAEPAREPVPAGVTRGADRPTGGTAPVLRSDQTKAWTRSPLEQPSSPDGGPTARTSTR